MLFIYERPSLPENSASSRSQDDCVELRLIAESRQQRSILFRNVFELRNSTIQSISVEKEAA